MSIGWFFCIVIGGVAGYLDARQKITGRPVRFRFWRARRTASGKDYAATLSTANAVANSAIGSAWAAASARRWLSVYGQELDTLDGFAKVGGLAVFRCPEQNYLTISKGKERIIGGIYDTEKLLVELFAELGYFPEDNGPRGGSVDMPEEDMPEEDMPEEEETYSAETTGEGFEHDFYKNQTRAAWMGGIDLNEPQTLLEVAACAFAGKKHFLNRTDFERETGLRTELNPFRSFWTKTGGLSLVAWAEIIAADFSYTGLIPLHPDGGADIQAVRDAIIELFSICANPSELNGFTRTENMKRVESYTGLYS